MEFWSVKSNFYNSVFLFFVFFLRALLISA